MYHTRDDQTGVSKFIIIQTAADMYCRFATPTQGRLWGVTLGQSYTFSGKIFVPTTNGFAPNLQVEYRSDGGWKAVIPPKRLPYKKGEWHSFEEKFTVPIDANSFYFGFQMKGQNPPLPPGSYFLAKDLMFTQGNKAVAYKPSTKYITDAIQNGSTDINGGLVLSNLMFARGADGVVRSGISGIASDNVSFFGGGTYQNALLDAGKEFKNHPTMKVGALDKKDGSGHRAFGQFAWDKSGQVYVKGDIEATAGKIGDYEIVGGNITGRTEGEERFLLTLGDLPNSPSNMTYTMAKALDNGWKKGTVLTSGNFYMSNTPIGGIEFKTDETWTYGRSVRISEPTVMRVSFGIGEESFQIPQEYSPKIKITAKATLNGTSLGDIQENTNITIPTAGMVDIELTVELRAGPPPGALKNWSVAWKLVSLSSFVVTYRLPTKRTCIGADGLYSYYSSLEYLFFKKGYGLAVRGNTDMPGVLLSGWAIAAGSAKNLWGAKKHLWKTCDRLMTGMYAIYHSVGHKEYSVQVTPKGAHKVANVVDLYNEFFTVYIYETDGGRMLDSDFFFTVIGNN